MDHLLIIIIFLVITFLVGIVSIPILNIYISDIRDYFRWKKLWKKHSRTSQFYSFINHNHRGIPIRSLKDNFKNDMSIWEDYREFLEELNKITKSERINRDLRNIRNIIEVDFLKRGVYSNIYTEYIGHDTKVTYVTSYGDKIIMLGNKLTYETSYGRWRYTISDFNKRSFVGLFNKIIQLKNEVYTNDNVYKDKRSDHPKWKLYNTLKDTISKREDQLKNSDLNDSDRRVLENELSSARSRFKKIKEKYGF